MKVDQSPTVVAALTFDASPIASQGPAQSPRSEQETAAAIQKALAALAAMTFDKKPPVDLTPENAAQALPVLELYLARKNELVKKYFDNDFRQRVMDRIAALD